MRAYFEWMPIRQTDMNDGLRVWRSFKLGKLVDLIMLDTRHYDRSIAQLRRRRPFLPYRDGIVEFIVVEVLKCSVSVGNVALLAL